MSSLLRKGAGCHGKSHKANKHFFECIFIIPICFDKNQQTKLCVFQSEYREYLVFFRQILHRHHQTYTIFDTLPLYLYIKSLSITDRLFYQISVFQNPKILRRHSHYNNYKTYQTPFYYLAEPLRHLAAPMFN